MDGAILEVNPSPDETLTFDILFNLKRLKMTDVNIRGVKAIFAPFGDSEKKKLFAAKLTFGDDQNEVYETRSDSNEVVKHSENIFDNVSGSGSGECATFVIVLIACFAYFLM